MVSQFLGGLIVFLFKCTLCSSSINSSINTVPCNPSEALFIVLSLLTGLSRVSTYHLSLEAIPLINPSMITGAVLIYIYVNLVAQMFEEPMEGTVELITVSTSRLPVQNLRKIVINVFRISRIFYLLNPFNIWSSSGSLNGTCSKSWGEGDIGCFIANCYFGNPLTIYIT